MSDPSSQQSSRYGSPAMFRLTSNSGRRHRQSSAAAASSRPGTSGSGSTTASSHMGSPQQHQQVPVHQLQQQLHNKSMEAKFQMQELFSSMLTRPPVDLLDTELIRPSRILNTPSVQQHPQGAMAFQQSPLVRSVVNSMQRIVDETDQLQTKLFRVADALGKVQDDIYERIKLETMSTVEPPPPQLTSAILSHAPPTLPYRP